MRTEPHWSPPPAQSWDQAPGRALGPRCSRERGPGAGAVRGDAPPQAWLPGTHQRKRGWRPGVTAEPQPPAPLDSAAPSSAAVAAPWDVGDQAPRAVPVVAPVQTRAAARELGAHALPAGPHSACCQVRLQDAEHGPAHRARAGLRGAESARLAARGAWTGRGPARPRLLQRDARDGRPTDPWLPGPVLAASGRQVRAQPHLSPRGTRTARPQGGGGAAGAAPGCARPVGCPADTRCGRVAGVHLPTAPLSRLGAAAQLSGERRQVLAWSPAAPRLVEVVTSAASRNR